MINNNFVWTYCSCWLRLGVGVGWLDNNNEARISTYTRVYLTFMGIVIILARAVHSADTAIVNAMIQINNNKIAE